MGFFGEVINEEPLDIAIPNDYQLHLQQASIVIKKGSKNSDGLVTLFIKPGFEEREFVLCTLNGSKAIYQCPLTVVLCTEDGPVTLRTEGGDLHLTGHWTWGDDADSFEHGSECDEEDSNDSDNEEAPELVNIDEVSSKRGFSEDVKLIKGKNEFNNSRVKTDDSIEPSKKKQKLSEASIKSASEVEKDAANKEKMNEAKEKHLKAWKVHPFGDEGIAIPSPKTITKRNGLSLTDFVMGKGSVVKPGATVKILYEGYFPNGTLFDSKLKKKQPFIFRHGTRQVIRGMDEGIEGMRVGGAREIVIPSELGYGERGIDDIPGNQTLVFRIRLLSSV